MSLVEAGDKPKPIAKTRGFQPGQSGNPKGRPLAARQRLNNAFVDKLAADFERNGVKAIQKLRHVDVASYIRVCASLLPKDVFVHQGPLAELTPDEIAALAYAARKAVAMLDEPDTTDT